MHWGTLGQVPPILPCSPAPAQVVLFYLLLRTDSELPWYLALPHLTSPQPPDLPSGKYPTYLPTYLAYLTLLRTLPNLASPRLAIPCFTSASASASTSRLPVPRLVPPPRLRLSCAVPLHCVAFVTLLPAFFTPAATVPRLRRRQLFSGSQALLQQTSSSCEHVKTTRHWASSCPGRLSLGFRRRSKASPAIYTSRSAANGPAATSNSCRQRRGPRHHARSRSSALGRLADDLHARLAFPGPVPEIPQPGKAGGCVAPADPIPRLPQAPASLTRPPPACPAGCHLSSYTASVSRPSVVLLAGSHCLSRRVSPATFAPAVLARRCSGPAGSSPDLFRLRARPSVSSHGSRKRGSIDALFGPLRNVNNRAKSTGTFSQVQLPSGRRVSSPSWPWPREPARPRPQRRVVRTRHHLSSMTMTRKTPRARNLW